MFQNFMLKTRMSPVEIRMSGVAATMVSEKVYVLPKAPIIRAL